ncbi:hypothetical protein [Luteimonas sp. 3794]|uniref:hypothetical protein n=1 Tax=Luteimonas sp. 3794 TaxID=2817730 RepID=UPI002859F8B1|nr:hypothetical protein [Luteimonas sp. 3794]MDR6993101.1 hypothetical protein [Luteimonas sp. 3794]
MHLIQLLLPVYDNAGRKLDRGLFDEVREALVAQFGGATAFARAPALGDWADGDGDVQRDDVVLVEVMAKTLDRAWWARYRETLEHRFQQETVLIRATRVEVL